MSLFRTLKSLLHHDRSDAETSQSERQIQAVLLSIFRAAGSADSVSELFAEIRLELGRLLDTSNLYVALYDKDTKLYSFPYHVDQYESDEQPPQKLTGSLTDLVRRTARPLLADEAYHAELIERGEAKLVGRASPSWLGVPLNVAGETIGVVAVQSYDAARPYSRDDLQALTFVAENIAQLVERRRSEQELRESERRFRALFEASPDGVFVEDFEGNVLDVNPAACALQRIAREDLIGMNVAELLPKENHAEVLRNFRRLASREITQLEGLTLTGDGKAVPVEVRSNTFEYRGKPALLIQVRDITERREHEKRLDYLARFDPLTGLPNRSLFEDRMRQAMLQARRNGGQVALLYLDLDEFKDVNDTLGHTAGDQLLKAVATRLQQQVREVDSVARLGGDEFAIIQTGIESTGAVSAFSVRILESMAQPFDIGGNVIHTSTSIGISVSSPGEDQGELMQQADRALYKAKEQGRNNFHFHDAQLAREVQSYVQIRQDLHGAVDRGEFTLAFQPQVDLASGDIVGCEALVRWNHPRRGLLYPGSFIPVTENTNLIVPLGNWVLAEACRQRSEWSTRGLPGFPVAVNLSAVQFRDPDFTATLEELLSASGVPAELLELEITETVLMQDSREVHRTLQRSSERGIVFSIDDFGTGYSSLRYLREFPVRNLKIAMEFVHGAIDDVDDGAIVEAVISLGHNLGLAIIAEGVETPAQAEFLRDRGCDKAQGFHFGRPLEPDDFAALFA